MLECEFSNPITFDGSPAETKQDVWEFSIMNCQGSLDFSTSTLPMNLEKIVSQDQEKEFFLEKSISYGDFLTIAFFIILISGLLVFGIRDFAKNRKLERL